MLYLTLHLQAKETGVGDVLRNHEPTNQPMLEGSTSASKTKPLPFPTNDALTQDPKIPPQKHLVCVKVPINHLSRQFDSQMW